MPQKLETERGGVQGRGHIEYFKAWREAIRFDHTVSWWL